MVVRVLRSGVKLLQQSGRKEAGKEKADEKKAGKEKRVKKTVDKMKTDKKKADKKKLSSSAHVSRGGKVKTSQSQATKRDRPRPLVVLGVSFTRHQAPVTRLSVDRNNWVLINMEDLARTETEFKVRVTAELSEDLTSNSSQPRYHLIRLAGASLASYQQDSEGRHSVIFPIHPSATTCRKLQFTSLSSDLGKEVKVVFSLEDGEGELVSWRVFKVKIRAEKSPEIPIIDL